MVSNMVKLTVIYQDYFIIK